jgi:uncharacterized protein (TIGR02266 family)
MSDPIPILANEEMRDILEALHDTLSYAIAQTSAFSVDDDPTGEVSASLERALRSVEAAGGDNPSMISIKGHAANALSRLRTALKALQEMDCADERVRLTSRAVARAVSLIYPFTQTEGPLFLVPRKSPQSRRKQKASSRRRSRPRPWFDVEIGEDAGFFTGLRGDIASGGLFITTYNIYPVGTKITVAAELGEDRVIMGAAKVTWVREHNPAAPEIAPGMGVVFNNLTKAAEKEINEYLADNDSIYYEAV